MIIAAFGIPGSGKSTTTREIGKILNIPTFHEPEEPEWGEVVVERELCGNFNAIMWFRSIRLPYYYKANLLREKGEMSMLDSCYDKLFHLYLGKPGMEWLLSSSDTYFEEMKSIAKKDYENIPDLDLIIFFKQSEDNWHKFIQKRNRNLDNESEFKDSFELQNAFLCAVETYCTESKCKLYVHEQSFTSPETEAKIIANKIKELSVG